MSATPELVGQAAALARRHATLGPGQVQRELRVGFAKAALLLGELEARGIVGPVKPDGRRDVLTGPECRGFRWIGQPMASCDDCGKPVWEHDGMMQLRDDGMPLYGGTEDWTLRPWAPGEAEEIRRKWAP